MRVVLAFLVAAACQAQPQAPRGVLRGELLERGGGKNSGDLVVRVADQSAYKCSFDIHTYVERDSMRITMAATRVGDHLEVIADNKFGAGLCYARTVRVVDLRATAVNPGYRIISRPRNAIEHIYPRGNITFAGVILRRNSEMLVIRTRKDGEKMVMLRSDTRYMDSGLASEDSALTPNTRVFIRGGKNLSGELEAYQIIWGELAGPKAY